MALPLGKKVSFPEKIDPSVLFRISRAEGRKAISHDIQFYGEDLWNCYECSWLNQAGLPEVAICRITYPANTPYIVESKSLKLFLAGFNNEKLSDREQFKEIVLTELSKLLETNELSIEIFHSSNWSEYRCVAALPGVCLEEDPLSNEEIRYTNLFRSLCPVTSQPDWATVFIAQRGADIEGRGLLSYLASFRNHQAFHEQCCEQIFCELFERYKPAQLSVACFFTRRGGIDINPSRHTKGYSPFNASIRLVRQ